MRVNVAVLGCGMVGKMIPGVMRQAGADITHIFGETKEEADGLVIKLGLEDTGVVTGTVAEDYYRIIKDGENNIDIVYDGLPNGLHKDANIAAAQAGKHVFTEKPLAPTIDDVLEMKEAIEANNVLFEVDSAYANHELPEFAQEEIKEGKAGKIYYGQFIYDQIWQKLIDAQIGWRVLQELAGKGKLIPDLIFHGNYSLEKITGGRVTSIDGKAWNVLPVRQWLNKQKLKEYLAEEAGVSIDKIDLTNADTFGGIEAPGFAVRPDLYNAMKMLGPLPDGVKEADIVPGCDPRLFTGTFENPDDGKTYHLSGDDIAEANLIVEKDGYTFPVYMRASQTLKGKNGFSMLLVTEKRSYEWGVKDPEHMEVEEEPGTPYIKTRDSAPGIFTGPGDHNAGYTTAVGLKFSKYLEKVKQIKAGDLKAKDIKESNAEILNRAVRTQFVMDQWLKLEPGWKTIQYKGGV